MDDRLSVGRATAAAVVTGVAGALAWGLVTRGIHSHLSYAAIGVGALVGWSMKRYGGRGGVGLGAVAALVTLAACFGGDTLAWKWLASSEGYAVSLRQAADLARSSLSPITYLIYAVGGFVAFSTAGGRDALGRRAPGAQPGRFTPMSPGAYGPPPTPLEPLEPLQPFAPPTPGAPSVPTEQTRVVPPGGYAGGFAGQAPAQGPPPAPYAGTPWPGPVADPAPDEPPAANGQRPPV